MSKKILFFLVTGALSILSAGLIVLSRIVDASNVAESKQGDIMAGSSPKSDSSANVASRNFYYLPTCMIKPVELSPEKIAKIRQYIANAVEREHKSIEATGRNEYGLKKLTKGSTGMEVLQQLHSYSSYAHDTLPNRVAEDEDFFFTWREGMSWGVAVDKKYFCSFTFKFED